MSSRNLVICEPETEYAVRLAAFLSEKKELAFQVKICSSLEQVWAMQDNMTVDLLLISENYPIEQRAAAAASRVMLLSAKRVDSENGEIPSVFKYQSGEEIFAQIIQAYATEENSGDLLNIRKKGQGKIIGFYSPVHRTGQTTAAIKKGEELSGKHNVLYLNLEAFAGLGGHFQEERKKNLSVLLYYAKQETGNLGMILTTLVKKKGDLYYIPPAVFPEDIKEVTEEEWLRLFDEIVRTSIYDVLVLDLGECVKGLYEILKLCDEVYLPAADDRFAAAKLMQYEETLRVLGYGEVWERMIRCDTGRTASGEDYREAGFIKGNRR